MPTETLVNIHRRLANHLNVHCSLVDVVFPTSELLSDLMREDREAMVSAVFSKCQAAQHGGSHRDQEKDQKESAKAAEAKNFQRGKKRSRED